jgi:hypothetical protein
MNTSSNWSDRIVVLLVLVVISGWSGSALAQDDDGWEWPREISAGEAVITLYQPQLDSWEGNDVESRAAVSVKTDPDAAPVFGAVWLSARFETDRDTRMVTFTDIRVPSVRFPDATEEQQRNLAEILEREIPTWNLEISLDQLLPTLDLADHAEQSEAGLKHDPPKIIIRWKPAVLIIIDGQPELQDIEGSDLQRVVNTPYVIVKTGGDFYLASDKNWFTARDILGPWKLTRTLPKDVQQIDAELAKQKQELLEQQETGLDGVSADNTDPRVPEIVVSTEPAELIFIDGNLEMAPLQGNEILYVGNTDSDVVFEVASQNYYVLLSGRWYRSKDLERGPWEHVGNDELTEAFAEIPADSDVGYLRSHVAGTDEAREAVLEQSIPQTAAVDRSDTSITVEYDGEPKFEAIEDTEMAYAVNTASSVIRVGSRYYACDQAIWYESVSPKGPWTVATQIPAEIATIPPSSPVYNVTYVHIYETTPEVVYVGYTPGYTGSYVSHGCVVYGTGWWYRPWWGHYYYARPSTWGFHVRWNPWWGWSFGVSYSTGPFTFSIGFGGWGRWGRWGGWWGPARYRPYARAGFRAGYRAGYRHGYRQGANRPVHHSRPATRNNIYSRPDNSNRVAKTRDRVAPSQQPNIPNDRANNIFTDRNGDVYRRNGDGTWDRRDRDGWSRTDGVPSAGDRTRPSTGDRERPSTGGGQTRPSTGDFQRPTTGGGQTRPSGQAPELAGGNLSSGNRVQPSTRPSTGESSRQPSYSSGSSMSRDYNARQRGSQRSQQMNRGGGASRSRGGGGRRR